MKVGIEQECHQQGGSMTSILRSVSVDSVQMWAALDLRGYLQPKESVEGLEEHHANWGRGRSVGLCFVHLTI